MLNILGMIILLIILFIIILLIIGIKIKFEYTKIGSEFEGCLKILIFKKLKVYSTTFPSDDDDEDYDENDEKKKQRDIKKILKLAKPCFEDLKAYLKSVLDMITITRIENHIIFGLDSYADTGKYIGIIWAVLSLINPLHDKLKLSAEPSFAGSRFDAKGINEFEIYPLKLVMPTIRLVLKKDFRKLIRGVLDER